MKKIISYIISIVLVLGLGVGIFFVVKSITDNKEHSLTVASGENGSVTVKIDDTPYTITSNLSKEFTVTKKSKITLKAKPNEHFLVLGWKVNDTSYSTNAEIEITVKKDVKYSVEFAASPIGITIVDTEANLNETFNVLHNQSLLSQLNAKYTAPNGYKYVYTIGSTEVSAETKITEEATITRTKQAIEYTVTFKNGETQVGEVQTYTIENKTITNPEFPTIENSEHYTLSWSEYNLDSLQNIVVNLIKTPKPYYVTFKNGETEIAKLEYNIENQTITEPAFPEFENSKHYNLGWEAYDLSTLQDITVNLTKELKVYSTSFKLPEGFTFDGTNNAKVVEYTLATYSSAQAPSLPEISHYTLAWDTEFTLTEENLGTVTEITATATPIKYTARFILPEGTTFTNGETECKTEYCITDETIICPEEINIEQHYSIIWSYDENLAYKPEILVITGTKDYTTYTTEFKLPEGFKFAENDSSTVIREYTLATYSSVTTPELPTVEHYSLAWDTEFTLTEENLGTITEITATATPIKYNAKFVLTDGLTFADGTTEYETTYDITTTELVCHKAVNLDRHSDVQWAEFTLTYDSVNTLIIEGTKQLKVYKTTFKLPEGFTFDGTNETKVVEYTLATYSSVTAPELPTAEHYTLTWNTEFTLTEENLGTVTEITATATPTTYYVTFKNGETEIAKLEYNIENQTIEEPAIPEIENKDHYENIAWESYDLSTLQNITVNLIKTAKTYTVTFKNGETQVGEVQTYTINDNFETKITAPDVILDGEHILAWEIISPETLGNIVIQPSQLPIHKINYDVLANGYFYEDLTTTYTDIAYYNGMVYRKVGSSNIDEPLSIDDVADNLFNNNADLTIVTINTTVVTSKEHLKEILIGLLENIEKQTISITYDTEEI